MTIDVIDEDGASNIMHPEIFGKPNKSELLKHLDKCEKIVQTWPKWKAESVRDALGIPQPVKSISSWTDVNHSLPETEPNTDGLACAVLTVKGNVYRARFMHDIHADGESKYWSGFDIDYKGNENEWYEIGEKVTHWIYLPIQGGAV